MIKSIVFGSNGYIGHHLAAMIEKRGWENSCADIHETSIDKNSNYFTVDVTKESDFLKLPVNVDYIFWFSGLTGTANGFDNYQDYISVNELGLLNLLTWMHKQECKAKIIFPSTRLVYQGKDGKLSENDSKEPKTIYAMNKLWGEEVLKMYRNAFRINSTIFRICVPYGNLYRQGFSYGTIDFFIKQAMKGENIILYGDGSLKRTFTHIEDICEIMLRSVNLSQTENCIFNIGGETFSLLEVANKVAKLYGVGVSFVDWPDMALKIESGHTVFSDRKLQRILNYTYLHSFSHEMEQLKININI